MCVKTPPSVRDLYKYRSELNRSDSTTRKFCNMSRNFVSFCIVGLALSIACVFAETPLHTCQLNERLGKCGQLCEEKCENPGRSACSDPTCRGVDCQCKPGFLRNSETEKCVRLSECPKPKCKANEVMAACGSTCEGTCEHPSRPERCKVIRCAGQGCQCDLSKGYVRSSKNGTCVRNQDDEKCAAKLKCPCNSAPALCGGVCESTCSNPEEIRCKLDPTNCVINCQCLNGFVRNEMTGECIQRNKCPLQSDK